MGLLVGERIRMLRRGKNLDQVTLAKIFGVSKQSISNWETNTVIPSVDKLVELADFFQCSTDFLVGRDAGYTETLHVPNSLTAEQISVIQTFIQMLAKKHEPS